MRVAVVGAGPSGLSACRHLQANSDYFNFICYEQCSGIGGTWLHSSEASLARENESNAYPASLAGQQPFTAYKTLQSNLPAKLMSYPDFTFTQRHLTDASGMQQEENVPWHFPKHYDLLNYLRAYAAHFELLPNIRLNEQVDSIQLEIAENVGTDSSNQDRYEVKTHNTLNGVESVEKFDAVLLCSGHYARPSWPLRLNLSQFQGRIMHAKYYNDPKSQLSACKKVVTLGGSVSGPDIALDIANELPEADVILASHTDTLINKAGGVLFGKKVRTKPDVVEITGPYSVKFADNSIEADVDAIIAGTGFEYYFPFLSKQDGLALSDNNKRLQPLYRHIVHINHPTLCIIGLNHYSVGFQLFDVQARYVMALWKKEFNMPSRAEMLENEENDYQMRIEQMKWPHHYAHKLAGPVARLYHDALVKESGVAPLSDEAFAIFERVCDELPKNPESFRNLNYMSLCNTSETSQKNDILV